MTAATQRSALAQHLTRLLAGQELRALSQPSRMARLLAPLAQQGPFAAQVAALAQTPIPHQLAWALRQPNSTAYFGPLVQHTQQALGCTATQAQEYLAVWIEVLGLVVFAPDTPAQPLGFLSRLRRFGRRFGQVLNRELTLFLVRRQRHGWFYAVFMLYAVVFTLCIAGLMGGLFGFILGASIGYLLYLDMWTCIYVFSAVFSLVGALTGILALRNDVKPTAEAPKRKRA
jgi:hypothetical protein